MDENAIGERILGCALTVHKALGPGLLENTYETCLAHELGKVGLDYQRQLTLPLVIKPHLAKLMGEAGFIGVFEQAGSERFVDSEGAAKKV